MWPQAPIPIAWGWIGGDGKPEDATPNVTSSWEDSFYDIVIAKEVITIGHTTFIQLRGPRFTPTLVAAPAPKISATANGHLMIEFLDWDEGHPDVFYRSIDGFAFIIYAPAHA
jgi:hypothetical protein